MEYEVTTDVVFRRIEDEMVLVNLKTDQIFTLNDTAAQFWELLAQGLDIDTIREQLLSVYDVSPGELEAEMTAVIDQLLAEGMIEHKYAG